MSKQKLCELQLLNLLDKNSQKKFTLRELESRLGFTLEITRDACIALFKNDCINRETQGRALVYFSVYFNPNKFQGNVATGQRPTINAKPHRSDRLMLLQIERCKELYPDGRSFSVGVA